MNALAPTIKRLRVADFYELTKPRIAFLVVVTTMVGYLAGRVGAFDWIRFGHLFVGTLGAAFGAGALNQALEREADGKMRRTRNRPIPAGRIAPGEAWAFGLTVSGASCLYLAAFVNGLTALLALATVVSYVAVYTPLKSVTSLSTVVGAVPGAIPPAGGWTAARGEINLEAWALFGILFFWQLPHFLAIAWIFREDYAAAGFPMLPVVDPDGAMTARQIVLYTTFLVPISLAPSLLGLTGPIYGIGAFVLGCGFLFVAARMAFARSMKDARRLLLASVLYLPSLLGLLALDRLPGTF